MPDINDKPPYRNFKEGQAENKPGHKPITAYSLPRWVYHPDLKQPIKAVRPEDFEDVGRPLGNEQQFNQAHVAAQFNDVQMLGLASDAEISSKSKQGMLPAHYAVKNGFVDIVQQLLDRGADVASQDQWGRTPADMAMEFLDRDHRKHMLEVLKGEQSTKSEKPHSKGDASAPQRPISAVGPIGMVFPGQGSQYVKMLAGVQDVPAVCDMLATAQKVLGYDLLKVCMEGPEERLGETDVCQPAMYVAGLAALELLRIERPELFEKPQIVAGLSLGEYCALTVAGLWSFEQGLRLVQIRGQAMHKAASGAGSEPQAMVSIAGLSREHVDELCAEACATAGEGAVARVANVLFPRGFSCAGTKAAIDELYTLATKAGALQTRLLKTSGAFHTPLMNPAREELEKALLEALPSMRPTTLPVYLNVTGKSLPAGTEPSVFVSSLAEQLVSPVLWEPLVSRMIDDGAQVFFELGPQKQLKAMMKRINQDVWKQMENISV